MSIVLPFPAAPRSPHHFPLSRSATPTASPRARPTASPTHSRPCTPPPLAPPIMTHLTSQQPISAPHTPVTMTHMIGMERCRSSEAVLGRPGPLGLAQAGEAGDEAGRGGRAREPKATSLLFNRVNAGEPISEVALAEPLSLPFGKQVVAHIENTSASPTQERARHPPVESLVTPEEEMKQDEEDKMDVDEELDVPAQAEVPAQPELRVVAESATQPPIWGMPRWGMEEERKEVRKGVRLVGMEELPGLLEQHSMIDTPSHVLFPWLHGICDDGNKGKDMAAFFGHTPPFKPPAYRGLCLVIAPPQPEEKRASSLPTKKRSQSHSTDLSSSISAPSIPDTQSPMPVDFSEIREPRERSETMSTSSDSHYSLGAITEATSVGDCASPASPSASAILSTSEEDCEADVQMHPCESKRVSPKAHEKGLDKINHPTPCSSPGGECASAPATTEPESDSEDDDAREVTGPQSFFLNALHALDVFDLPGLGIKNCEKPKFKSAKLPQQINLRNLNIQQIKYATISDVILYATSGVQDHVLSIAENIAQAQEHLHQHRMDDYYQHVQDGEGEGVNKPVRYGIWVLVEPFRKVQTRYPQLVNFDYLGRATANSPLTDLFEREMLESRAMTGGSEVVEGLWVGNDADLPGATVDGAGSKVQFDLCLSASDGSDMPSPHALNAAGRELLELDQRRDTARQELAVPSGHSWTASPATIALRNLLSPATSPLPLPEVPSKRLASHVEENDRLAPRHRRAKLEHSYVALECAGSARPPSAQYRDPAWLVDRMLSLIYFLRQIVEGRDKSGNKRKVLVHCQDGYTESTIVVLCYIMSSLSITLPEAYLHLQMTAKRSFFLYPADKHLLRKVDAKLSSHRRAKATKLLKTVNAASTDSGRTKSPTSSSQPSSPTSPTSPPSSRWQKWSLSLHSQLHGNTLNTTAANSNAKISLAKQEEVKQITTVQAARELLDAHTAGGREEAKKAKVWFEDKRFDGFPSRILPFLYLGNLDHAGNAAMLQALGITHVVSVGESLIQCPDDHDPMYGRVGSNALCNAYRAGQIQVLDLNDIRDDGNDPLRPLIAQACEWIEAARAAGGHVLVHCRVGVSRSASIVMAYMMQHQKMGLMDAYLVTRARRLNVLIQPNLRFFHELFGWEIELARREEADLEHRKWQATAAGMEEAVRFMEAEQESKRRILYSWPAFCRDLHCLNRRFLCN